MWRSLLSGSFRFFLAIINYGLCFFPRLHLLSLRLGVLQKNGFYRELETSEIKGWLYIEGVGVKH